MLMGWLCLAPKKKWSCCLWKRDKPSRSLWRKDFGPATGNMVCSQLPDIRPLAAKEPPCTLPGIAGDWVTGNTCFRAPSPPGWLRLCQVYTAVLLLCSILLPSLTSLVLIPNKHLAPQTPISLSTFREPNWQHGTQGGQEGIWMGL